MDKQIQHHGVKGMKWGVRRYQNKDGSLTALGKMHEKVTSPEFKKAAKTGATITAGLVAAYGTHKFLNNPKVVAQGSKAVHSILKSAGKVKVSAMNSTEYKIAKPIVKGAIKTGKKVGDTAKQLGLKDVAAVLATGGAMVGTEKYLSNKYGDTGEKVLKYGRQPRKGK